VMILVGLGVNELSVSPVTLPQVKKLIRSMSFQDAVSVAKAALDVKTANELLEFCQREMKARFAGLPIWNNGW